MSKHTTQPDADIVLFGCQGDLTRRKLLPSLYQLEKANLLSVNSKIIGVARNEFTAKSYLENVKKCLTQFIKEPLDESVVKRFLAKISYIKIDLLDESSYGQLADEL